MPPTRDELDDGSPSDDPGDVTLLLRAASSNDPEHVERLMEAIYDDMRRIAQSHLAGERANHTLQPTALVHEAYVKLVNQHRADFNDRLHFLAIASRIMRRILIDHARAHRATKRGGANRPAALELQEVGAPARGVDLMALDEAMVDLASLDERQAQLVELRYFGGCTLDEAAEVLGFSLRTANREWTAAKGWLFRRLSTDGEATVDAG